MEQFYMCYSYRHAKEDIIEFAERHGAGLLTTAHVRWSERTERFNDMWVYDCPTVLDSGGYNVQSYFIDQYGNLKEDEKTIEEEKETDAPFYPWTVEEYHEWLHEEGDGLEWAASMDYACEERFDALWDTRARMEATIENTIKQHELMKRDGSDYTLLPVLQGRTVDGYVECARRYRDAGIDISYVGLGTVCRLSSTLRIIEIEEELRERVPEIEKIHGFGVKLDAYRMGAGFETADTQAWIYNASYSNLSVLSWKDGDVKLDAREHDGEDYVRKLHGFRAYYAYVMYEVYGREDIVEEIIDLQEDMEYGQRVKG